MVNALGCSAIVSMVACTFMDVSVSILYDFAYRRSRARAKPAFLDHWLSNGASDASAKDAQSDAT